MLNFLEEISLKYKCRNEYYAMKDEENKLYSEMMNMLYLKKEIKIFSSDDMKNMERESNQLLEDISKNVYDCYKIQNPYKKYYSVNEPECIINKGKVVIIVRYEYYDLINHNDLHEYLKKYGQYVALKNQTDTYYKTFEKYIVENGWWSDF